eukprot:TRINITY_DN2668_c0_g1_i1.p1 TRINITY_DN2668_c0_g1~~TRINITY_DN2668_c0_g1_i1.p1  ORF type:complete len:134 (+),score=33.18 TRINITY_DN2668_c0_g1_i1:25-402(+)
MDPTTEAEFAQGLVGLLTPLARQYEERMESVQESQKALEAKIDKLVSELEGAMACADLPDVTEYLAMLSSARQRITRVNTSLTTIRERLTRLHNTANQKYSHLKAQNDSLAAQVQKLEDATSTVA